MAKKKREVQVKYSGGLDTKLDEKIMDFMNSIGFSFWASGMEMTGKGMRDLSFDEERDG